MQGRRIAFYANSFSIGTASIRLRCVSVMAGLRALGVAAEPFDVSRMSDYEVVVFSKTYDDKARRTAENLRAAGTRVVLDLCDNHFYGEETTPQIAQRAASLGAMLAIADHVTVATHTLGEQLRQRYGVEANKVSVVPDPIEDPNSSSPSLTDRFALFRLERFLRTTPGALRLLWFGNHGAGHAASGMTDLLHIAPAINHAARKHNLLLTVISNNYRKYVEISKSFDIGTHYLAWSQTSISAALKMHDVAVIPITPNSFTIAKSINRPATAIMAGLGVIADAIPSYEELRPFVHLDDWTEGLEAYASQRAAIRSSLAEARAALAAKYDLRYVCLAWRDVLLGT